jgi:hypothetical protein
MYQDPVHSISVLLLVTSLHSRSNVAGINLLKPACYVMHHQFKIQQLYCIYVFCIYLRTNNDLCHLQHKMIGFYNRDGKCLQRGTNWVFK